MPARRDIVNANHKKSNGDTLLVLGIVCVFLFIVRVMLMRDHPNRDLSPTVEAAPTFPMPNATPPQDEGPAPAMIEAPDETPPTPEAVPAPREPEPQPAAIFAGEPYRYYPEPGEQAEEARFLASLRRVPGATDVGVVDVRRLLAAERPQSDAALKGLSRRIKRAVATRAAEHGFALVLDRSAEGLYFRPVLLDTEGLPDITDEVLQDLSE